MEPDHAGFFNQKGQSVLMLAVLRKSPEVVRQLLGERHRPGALVLNGYHRGTKAHNALALAIIMYGEQ